MSSRPTSTGGDTSETGESEGGAVIAPDGYYVRANRIYDEDGHVHRFRGIARPSLEWKSDGENISLEDFRTLAGWGANVVRIALNQSFWLGDSAHHDPAYPSTIDQAIVWAQDAGLDVILDLHWSDRGDAGSQAGQQMMADERSVIFWREVATRYASNGRVLFELYNEPHDVSWEVWQRGGLTADGFRAAGMQDLYDAVRGSGADNLVIVGGLRYAFDLSGVSEHPLEGYNIAYASHIYNFPDKQSQSWPSAFGRWAEQAPVLLTEFGDGLVCDGVFVSRILQYAEQLELSWTAWAWYPAGCDFPSLITDWAGTPTTDGAAVKEALRG